ncbi:hypothetical protein [Vibrio crassostreae]|uniref:hypothetical protein n=1 Tax=Vibrio crassostreae TaxID=246167 RepID=UPI001B309DEF|nr:hypothetical protein [Vibrio crassostreae]
MCPSNNNQTVSNGLIATSDSTLELEGSSKNDNYLVRDILKNGWSSFGGNSSPIWADYDAIEIMFCVEYEANDQSILEPFSMNDVQEVKNENIKYWSVYGHCIEGGIECLHDCKNQSEASVLARHCELMISCVLGEIEDE